MRRRRRHPRQHRRFRLGCRRWVAPAAAAWRRRAQQHCPRRHQGTARLRTTRNMSARAPQGPAAPLPRVRADRTAASTSTRTRRRPRRSRGGQGAADGIRPASRLQGAARAPAARTAAGHQGYRLNGGGGEGEDARKLEVGIEAESN
eukprot:31182-Chlamydomonas_euryale.AAC.3